MTVLIGGGSGFVGRHLRKILAEDGMKSIVVSRKAKDKDVISWDDVEKCGLPQDTTAVVNVAGENILNPMRRLSQKSYMDDIWKSRVDTTRLLAKAIREAETPPKAFVTMSGVGYYPPSKDAIYTETGTGGTDWLADLSREWEKAGTLPQNVPTRRVVIRCGVVLGRDGGLIKELWPIHQVAVSKMGSGEQFFPWIHVADIAGIIKFAIQKDNVSDVLNGVAPEVATNAMFSMNLAAALKRPYLPVPVPAWYLNMLFGKDRAMIITEGQCVVPKRTLRLGYKFEYPTLKSACEQIASTKKTASKSVEKAS